MAGEACLLLVLLPWLPPVPRNKACWISKTLASGRWRGRAENGAFGLPRNREPLGGPPAGRRAGEEGLFKERRDKGG